MTIWRMRIACWLPKATTHTHTHRICKTYFFPIAIMVARTHLNVTLRTVSLLLWLPFFSVYFCSDFFFFFPFYYSGLLYYLDGLLFQCRGTRWRSWLRHCATSRKVAGSIPDGVIGIFHWHNPTGHTMTLGSTQLLIEMSTRNISWGVKAAGA